VIPLAVLFAVGGALAQSNAAPSQDSAAFPAYVMDRIDDQYRGRQSHGTMTMNVKTTHWTRSMTLETWSLGKDHSLVRILKPKKDKGNATLKAKNVLFTYLSKTDRTIKISSGMMGGSWMGSHFTNDDLVRNSRLADDFDIEMTFEGDKGAQEICSFELTPKPNAPVVWGKIQVVVRSGDLQPLSQTFFDEDLKPVKKLEFQEIKEIGGRTVPTRMVMRPLDGSGEYTEIVVDELDFDVELDKGFFSLQRLKRM